MVWGQSKRFAILSFALLLVLSVSVFAAAPPSTNPNSATPSSTLSKPNHLPFAGVYGPCPQDSRAASRPTSQPVNGTNVTLPSPPGSFPQPNNFSCLPTSVAIMIANQNITNLTSIQIFDALQNVTNGSNHMTVVMDAVVQLLNQTGANVTITVSGPYATNITRWNITSMGGTNVQVVNLTNHPGPGTGGGTTPTPGSNGGTNGGSGTGTGGGAGGSGGGSGPTSVTGTGFIRADGSAHFVLVYDSAYCEPFIQGVYYFNPMEGYSGAVGLKWSCYITYWDPLDGKTHQGIMTMDGQWIKINGQWAKVGDTVRITAG
ncbi:MAG: hypothetical protein ACP5NS_00965 [Candidatus Pacearchaeota archaeon]